MKKSPRRIASFVLVTTETQAVSGQDVAGSLGRLVGIGLFGPNATGKLQNTRSYCSHKGHRCRGTLHDFARWKPIDSSSGRRHRKDQSDSKTSANVLIYCLLDHTLVNRRST